MFTQDVGSVVQEINRSKLMCVQKREQTASEGRNVYGGREHLREELYMGAESI